MKLWMKGSTQNNKILKGIWVNKSPELPTSLGVITYPRREVDKSTRERDINNSNQHGNSPGKASVFTRRGG